MADASANNSTTPQPMKWSWRRPRFIVRIFGISMGTGAIAAVAAVQQPLLIIPLALLTVGYALNIKEQRDFARNFPVAGV
jgi:hypothetical protein